MFDCNKTKYVYIKHNNMFLFKNNRRLSVANLQWDFYSWIFIDMKFEKPLYEMKRSKMWNISAKDSWKRVYRSKILYMYENCIAEFNYKLVHGILNNNVSVHMWKKNA